MHPLNKNQLYYPGFVNSGNGNGNGGDGIILPTDFGDWTDLPAKSAQIFDEQIAIQYKLDMANYPTKAILYLIGQFGIKNTFVGSLLLLGVLPEDTRPKNRINKNITVQGTECYLIIETNGNVKLSAVTGDLPVTDGDTESFPYFLNLDYNPDITDAPPVETFTANRSGNFTRNNCGVGYTGSVVTFSKAYTSNVSQQAAETIADANFANDGQVYANNPDHGTCTVTEAPSFSAQRSQSFTRNNCAAGELGSAVPFTKNYTASTQQAANDAAANDTDFATEGQAFANDSANGATCTVIGGTYYAQRTQSFTRNNCAQGSTGSAVAFTKNYTGSTQQAADDAAANDPDFATEGQAFANDSANGATCTVVVSPGYYLYMDSFNPGSDPTSVVRASLTDPNGNSINAPQNIQFNWSLKINGNPQSGTATIVAGTSYWPVWEYDTASETVTDLQTSNPVPNQIGNLTIITG
ncbi:DUF5977 domain-containing protein [Pedobacter miscanthi]|uniref:DUF5977 domain-containing protein n=1 Tax=Pedobacter miscanthi TaxID=2259170 RepID=UPI00292FB333|nr:DUF5977 domain-containing protein [Pedobacter miscanthi]